MARSLELVPAAIDTAAPLDQIGVDSLMALGLAGGLAAWLDRDVPATLAWDHRSIDAIADALATAAPARALPAGVVALQPDGDGVPIFGFPGLAGTPLAFAALAARLGSGQPFYGLAVPGYDGLPGGCDTVEAIAAAMLAMVRQVRPTGPYRLAGYCFGGLLAYEAARQLSAAGEPVTLLAVYDAFTPAGRVRRPAWQRSFVHLSQLAHGTQRLGDLAGKLRWGHLSRMRTGVDPAGPATRGADAATAADRFWHTNSRAAAAYRLGPHDGPVVWFNAADREPQSDFYRMLPCGGWTRCTSGRVTAVTIPGNHGTLIAPEHARTAADALRPFLGLS